MNHILLEERKKKIITERLLAKKITTTKEGKDIYDCTYRELKLELVLSEFR